MFKAFTTRLSKNRRRVLKNKVFMAAHEVFTLARHLFYLSCRDPTQPDVNTTMDMLSGGTVDEFLRRCRNMSKTWNEKRYVSYLVNKHIWRIINYSFVEHLGRLRRRETLNILNDVVTEPTTLLGDLASHFIDRQGLIQTKFKTQIRII